MQSTAESAEIAPIETAAIPASNTPRPQLKHPIGAVDPTSEDSVLCGWAWNELRPTRPTRLIFQVNGEPVAVTTPQDFRPDLVAAGISHGCFAFRWRVPDLYRDGKPHDIRVIHADFGLELPGSPCTVTLEPAIGKPDAGRVSSPFVNPAFSVWPNGLQGQVASNPAEVAPGVVVTADATASLPRFMLIEPRLQDSESAAVYGVRIAFETAGSWWLHHRLSPRPHPELAAGVELSVELALGEATEAVAQAPCELWLTQQGKDGFVKLRRLLRGRVFRRPTLLTYLLRLSAGEQKLAAAKLLHVGITVERCRVLRVYPSQVVRPRQPPVDGFRGFEDDRLDATVEACRRLAAVNGRSELFATLVPPLPPSPDTPAPKAADAVAALPAPPLTPTAQYPFTQIVVPVYNGGSVIMECLRSVQRETTTPFQALIVNDGGREQITAMLRDFAAMDPRFLLLDRAENRGYTKSINHAVSLSSADWLVILNSDTVVSHGWLGRLHDATASRPNVGMVGPLSNAASYQSIPRVRDPNGNWSRNAFLEPAHVRTVQSILDKVTERAYPSTPLLNGFCTLIKREVFDRCGLYDEDAFPMGYGEENDLCIRAGKAGFALVIADDCFVYHHKSVSFGIKGRKLLTRAGSLELVNKHPGISIPALEQAMQDNPVLIRLRQSLSNLQNRIR